MDFIYKHKKEIGETIWAVIALVLMIYGMHVNELRAVILSVAIYLDLSLRGIKDDLKLIPRK